MQISPIIPLFFYLSQKRTIPTQIKVEKVVHVAKDSIPKYHKMPITDKGSRKWHARAKTPVYIPTYLPPVEEDVEKAAPKSHRLMHCRRKEALKVQKKKRAIKIADKLSGRKMGSRITQPFKQTIDEKHVNSSSRYNFDESVLREAEIWEDCLNI